MIPDGAEVWQRTVLGTRARLLADNRPITPRLGQRGGNSADPVKPKSRPRATAEGARIGAPAAPPKTFPPPNPGAGLTALIIPPSFRTFLAPWDRNFRRQGSGRVEAKASAAVDFLEKLIRSPGSGKWAWRSALHSSARPKPAAKVRDVERSRIRCDREPIQAAGDVTVAA